MVQLLAALTAFVGTHLLLSHPLRAPLVARMGASAFLGVYSLVAFATLGWAVHAFRGAPAGDPAWLPGDGLWMLATLLMLVASILFAGSLIGNPALPGPPVKAFAAPPARGVFAITRHPMMWGFALWGLVHILVSPRPPVIALSLAMILLALGGAWGQDAKKAALMGDGWSDWTSRTAFVPFGGQVSGKIGWGAAWPGSIALFGGIALWLIATWAHPWAGAPAAGVWRWIG